MPNTKESGKHGPAGCSEFVPGEGWVRSCKCGRTFQSWSWKHVPAFYDHLATKERPE